jgi:hypothetical protein
MEANALLPYAHPPGLQFLRSRFQMENVSQEICPAVKPHWYSGLLQSKSTKLLVDILCSIYNSSESPLTMSLVVKCVQQPVLKRSLWSWPINFSD